MATWPEEHTEALREFMRENRTASHADIAEMMNKRFCRTFTRNAIVGRAKRLGIPSNNPPCIKSKGKAMPRRTEFRMMPKVKPPPPPPPPPPPQPAIIRCVEVEPRHISLLDLASGECRWPYGDVPNMTFCGNPAAFGSYCGGHYALSVRGANHISARIA